ncbi:hypothetical protein [Streptomyces sp. NPDC096934]|uniref:hypothetical protein n=1 Tax=Streptomyces sp. NPDC096934 TaxID=3155551 RepID=UPI003325FF54
MAQKLVVGLGDDPAVGGPVVGEELSVRSFVGECQQRAGVVVALFDVRDKDGEEGLTLACAVGGAFVDPVPTGVQAMKSPTRSA